MPYLDIDQFAGNSLDHQRDSAAGPLTAAMRTQTLVLSGAAEVTLPSGSYEPLLQIAPLVDLEDETWLVEVVQAAPLAEAVPLRFAPFSEKDGFLSYLCPKVGADSLLATAITLQLRVRRNGLLMPANQTRRLLHVRFAEGRFAKLLAVTQTETLRTRRLMREISARRTTALAQGAALDQIGRELAVPRLESKISARRGEIVLIPEPETDVAYRRRLDIYRPFLMPTRAVVLKTLNGDDSPLRRAGAPARFDVLETDNPFMVGFKVFGVGKTASQGKAMRAAYLLHLRKTTLIDVTQNVPGDRKMSSTHRRTENEMRLRLRNALDFETASTRQMAPWLAQAFDRAVRVAKHIGVDPVFKIVRAQDDGGGSRLELGLAAEIHEWPTARVQELRTKIMAGPPSDDPSVQGILATLQKANLTADNGHWFFTACGFRTVLPLKGDLLLLSHISMGSLTVDGGDGFERGAARLGTAFSAAILDDGTQLDAALANALSGGPTGWPVGVADWTVVTPAQQNASLAGAEFADVPQADAFAAMGFGKLADYAAFVQSLRTYPAHAVRVLKLNAGLTAILNRNDGTATDRLGLIADTFGAMGAASLMLLKSGAGLVLVVSSIGLPQLGTNIGPRRSSDFFWGATTISGGQTETRGQGTKTLIKAVGDGVYAASTLAYSRIGATDPFEWRITLPHDAAITLEQYEILMNMLGRMFPVGVEINTWDIRRRNVTLDGLTTTPLSPRLSRSFRPFHRPRFNGTGAANPTQTSR